jgi:hypothetical protein
VDNDARLTDEELAAVEAAALEIESLTDPQDRPNLREQLRQVALEHRQKGAARG